MAKEKVSVTIDADVPAGIDADARDAEVLQGVVERIAALIEIGRW